MAFSKKTWKDRVSQYINRRLLTDSDGNTQQVTVTRDEGSVTEAGDAFSASNMNDLEDRIDTAFGALTAADIPYDNTVSGLTADDVQEAVDELVYKVGDTIDITGSNISGFSFGSGVFGFLNLSKPISSDVTSVTINGHVQVFDENANAYINSNISQAGTSRNYTITKAGIVINFSFSPSISNKGANLWWFDTTTTVTFN